MAYTLPGKKTKAFLEHCKTHFKHGLTYDLDAKRANSRGFRPPAQIMLDRAKGDFIWDLDGNKFIDFQNGWATNPLGNCHPEILEAVRKAHERYGYHWEHPLRFELAEKLALQMLQRCMAKHASPVLRGNACVASMGPLVPRLGRFGTSGGLLEPS